MVDEFEAKVGLDRLRCLHVNDSKVPLGSNRDRHANLGEGELGRKGLRPFLSEPRFEELPGADRDPGTGRPGPRSQGGAGWRSAYGARGWPGRE